jgi:hypothetical protein
MRTAKPQKMIFSRAVRAWFSVVESLVRTQSIQLQKTQHAPYGLSLATTRTYKKAQVPPDVSLAEHASCFFFMNYRVQPIFPRVVMFVSVDIFKCSLEHFVAFKKPN